MTQEWEPLKDGGRVLESCASGLDSESRRIGEGKVAFRKKIREAIKAHLEVFLKTKGTTYRQMKKILEAELSRELMVTIPKMKLAGRLIGVCEFKFRSMLQVDDVFEMRNRAFVKRVPGWQIARDRAKQNAKNDAEKQ